MRILYISFNNSSNSGVNTVRVGELLDYFSKENIEVVHLTPFKSFTFKKNNNIVVKIPELKKNFLTFLVNYIRPIFSINDGKEVRMWIKQTKEYIRENKEKMGKFDLIYVNTQPVTPVEIGIIAKELFNSKLVVDFQDSYYFNPYKRNLKILDPLLKKKEESYLNYCDLLITNTPSAEKIYKKNYPNLKNICLTNMIPKTVKPQKQPRNEIFKILYGGSLNIGRDLFPLLKAIGDNERFSLEVIGNFSAINKIRYFFYKKIVWKGRMNIQDYFKSVERSDIGVVLQSFKTRPTGVSCIAAKTYEYMGFDKAIIYIGPEGDNAEMIRKYSTNKCVITNVENINSLINFLNNFSSKKTNTKEDFSRLYSSDNIASELVNQLRAL